LDRGVFTFQFTSLLQGEPELTPNQTAAGLTKLLKPHGQVLLLGATSPSLLDHPIFRETMHLDSTERVRGHQHRREMPIAIMSQIELFNEPGKGFL
jgi:hypothetical protein